MATPDDAFDKAYFIPADVSLAEEILADADERIARVEREDKERKSLSLGNGSYKRRRLPVL